MLLETESPSNTSTLSREEAYGLWSEKVERWAVLKVRTYRAFSKAEQEDILSQVRERFVKNVHTLEDRAKLRAWSDQLVQNFCRSELKKHLRQSELEEPLSEDREWPSGEKNPEEDYEHKIKEQLLGRILDLRENLQPKDREVIEEIFFNNRPNKELAAEEGVVASTISHRRSIAIGNLRKLIEQEAQRDKKFGCVWVEYGADLLGDG